MWGGIGLCAGSYFCRGKVAYILVSPDLMKAGPTMGVDDDFNYYCLLAKLEQ